MQLAKADALGQSNPKPQSKKLSKRTKDPGKPEHTRKRQRQSDKWLPTVFRAHGHQVSTCAAGDLLSTPAAAIQLAREEARLRVCPLLVSPGEIAHSCGDHLHVSGPPLQAKPSCLGDPRWVCVLSLLQGDRSYLPDPPSSVSLASWVPQGSGSRGSSRSFTSLVIGAANSSGSASLKESTAEVMITTENWLVGGPTCFAHKLRQSLTCAGGKDRVCFY